MNLHLYLHCVRYPDGRHIWSAASPHAFLAVRA